MEMIVSIFTFVVKAVLYLTASYALFNLGNYFKDRCKHKD